MKTNSKSTDRPRSITLFDMSGSSGSVCVWSEAGVIPRRACINAFDCLGCPLYQRLKREVAAGRLINGRVPTDWRLSPHRRFRSAEQMKCRHMLSGRVSFKYCMRHYDCGSCEYNQLVEEETLVDCPKASRQVVVSGFMLAQNYYYHHGHTWARVEYGGRVRLGLDDFASRLLGPFSRIELPVMGTAVQQGDRCCRLVRGDLEAECLCPVDGVVVAVNPVAVKDNPAAERSPFDAGWLIVVEPVRLAGRLRKLLFGQESVAWLEQEARQLAAMVADDNRVQLAATGGKAIRDIYGQVPGLDWRQLQRTFLRT
jgi:glycine cleavage system H lipoate-binding protein